MSELSSAPIEALRHGEAPPAVSVVMPTFNRVEMLCRVLPSYLRSATVRELIVVDDACTDETGQRIQQLATHEPRLRYFRNERNLGAPTSRNRGARQARGEWVLETEDDLELGEHCLEILLEHAQKTQADIIAGRRIWMRLGETEETALARADRDRRPPLNERLLDINSHATTPDDIEIPLLDATMLIRRKIFDNLQYYADYAGSSSWREESDFQLSAAEKGYRIVFCPHAVSYHYSRASQSFGRNRIKGTFIYAYRVYRNNLHFLRRHQAYLRIHLPRSLWLGSPRLTGLAYGLYRGAWLILAESVRLLRARRYGAQKWE
jgi:GT2 family glycosyltransferase